MKKVKLISELNTLVNSDLIAWAERNKQYMEFKSQLTGIINSNSIDTYVDAPDFVIADYIMTCLHNLRKTNKEIKRLES